MRPTSLALVTAALLPFGCDNAKPKKKEEAPPQNQTVQVAPKKPVQQTELPPLAADPGGATGKPVWQAAFGGLGTDATRGVVAGANGEAFVAGYYESEIDFGGSVGKKPTAGKSDAFLAKLGADGKIAWAQTWGAAREDVANAIAINAKKDKVAVAGSFLDEIKISTFTKKATNSDDLYIVQFDKDGNADWLWTAGGIDSDGVNTIAATPDGGWVIGGSFTASIEIATGAGKTNIKSKGGTDALLIKLAASGDTEWVKSYGGRYADTIMHVAVDANSNIFVQGVFMDTADFGGKEPLKGAGGKDNDVVLAKYDANGDHVWSQRFGNAFNEVAGGLAVDPSGNVTIAGSFENKGSISFGQGDDHVSLGEADVYVARFANDGKLLWAKSFGGERVDVANDVAVDSAGNAVITGWFEGLVDFGKGTATSKGGNNKDAFVAKLDAKGTTVWVQTFGDKDHDQGRAVTIDDKGDIYVAGLYRFSLSVVEPAIKQVLDTKDPVQAKVPKADIFVVKLQR
jgi:hypothetical protein